MQGEQIEKVELRYLKQADYPELSAMMHEVYPHLPDSAWTEKQLRKLIRIFRKGQIAILVNDQLAGCALSIMLNEVDLELDHSYDDITGNETFDTHDPDGDVLYGIDVFIKPKFRGLRLGRRLYDYRKELCEELNLKGILFGGRLPNYHKFSGELTPRQYIEKVKQKELEDPVLNFQIANDFHVKKILKNYLTGDKESQEYAALMEWNNIYYVKKNRKATQQKSVVRLGLIQWQMRSYKSLEDLLEQVEYFLDAVSAYRCDFVLFPEFFNAPLMSQYNHLSVVESIRKLASYSDELRDRFLQYAISYNVNIIAGSMPVVKEDDRLYNVGYLLKRNGEWEEYVKIHVTPDEEKVWGLAGGDKIKTFDTDCGKVGILICYDVEFPELSRLMADQGLQLLFVPFLTDTQNGYNRVRYCAQARAIENECYVAIAGSVGNLPKVHNMDMQFAQSMIFTPCDFAFPTNGVKAEATNNTEMILVGDVDLDLLKELHNYGSVRNLIDRRTDLYELKSLQA